MRKIISYMIMAISLALSSGYAISSIMVDHTHDGAQTVSHDAELDANGCHVGPGGFHCH